MELGELSGPKQAPAPQPSALQPPHHRAGTHRPPPVLKLWWRLLSPVLGDALGMIFCQRKRRETASLSSNAAIGMGHHFVHGSKQWGCRGRVVLGPSPQYFLGNSCLEQLDSIVTAPEQWVLQQEGDPSPTHVPHGPSILGAPAGSTHSVSRPASSTAFFRGWENKRQSCKLVQQWLLTVENPAGSAHTARSTRALREKMLRKPVQAVAFPGFAADPKNANPKKLHATGTPSPAFAPGTAVRW